MKQLALVLTHALLQFLTLIDMLQLHMLLLCYTRQHYQHEHFLVWLKDMYTLAIVLWKLPGHVSMILFIWLQLVSTEIWTLKDVIWSGLMHCSGFYKYFWQSLLSEFIPEGIFSLWTRTSFIIPNSPVRSHGFCLIAS